MSLTKLTPDNRTPIYEGPAIPQSNTVVAVVIERQGKIAVFKRSQRLDHDKGLWHCVTGFVENETTPEHQAVQELFEETGLQSQDLLEVRHGPVLVVKDNFGAPWLIHTFTVKTSQRRLKINWEHESYRWTTPCKVKRFTNRVSWLDTVLGATGHI